MNSGTAGTTADGGAFGFHWHCIGAATHTQYPLRVISGHVYALGDVRLVPLAATFRLSTFELRVEYNFEG